MESKLGPDFSTEELWDAGQEDKPEDHDNLDGFEVLPKQTARREVLAGAKLPGIIDGQRVDHSNRHAPHKRTQRLKRLEEAEKDKDLEKEKPEL